MVTFFGWEGDLRPGGKWWQPTAGDGLESHLQADCLYTGISSGPNARQRAWENFTFCIGDHPVCSALNQQALNQIKPAYNVIKPGAYRWMCLYTTSFGTRPTTKALHNSSHHLPWWRSAVQYSLCPPAEGWPGWVFPWLTNGHPSE